MIPLHFHDTPENNFERLTLRTMVLENLITAVLLIRRDLTIEYMNPAAKNLLAISGTRLAEMRVSDLFVEQADDTFNALERALETGGAYTKREAQLQIKGSGTTTVDYTATPLMFQTMREGSQVSTVLLEMQQVDRLKRIAKDETLISTQQATKALIRGVAHEVKNPLGGIRGAAQLLVSELHTDELRDYTNVIIEEVDRLRNLVDRMLGPHQLPQKSKINIHEVLERVRSVVLVESNAAIAIERDYDVSVPEITADKDQLIQAMLNIVRNAMQALLENPGQQNPTVTLVTRVLSQITVANKRYRQVARIQISDNGPGVPQSIIDTLFYPMVSARAVGTGLGLSIAQSIINQHEGIIECTSKPGHTTFTIIIPLEPSK